MTRRWSDATKIRDYGATESNKVSRRKTFVLPSVEARVASRRSRNVIERTFRQLNSNQDVAKITRVVVDDDIVP